MHSAWMRWTTVFKPTSKSRKGCRIKIVHIIIAGMLVAMQSTYAFSAGVCRVVLGNPSTRRRPTRSASTHLSRALSLLGGVGASDAFGASGAKPTRFRNFPTNTVQLSRIALRPTSRCSSYRLFACAKGDTTGENRPGSPDEPLQLEEEYSSDDPFTMRLAVPTPEDMEDVGAVLSIGTEGGDTILLGGDLGAGKTCLSRGFVRTRTGDSDMRVTSPTYLLSNSYPADGGEIIVYHMDLYRLKGGEDLEPLDMNNVVKNGICLIEWPSRLGEELPLDRLDVTFRIHDGEELVEDEESKTRFLTLRAHSQKWEERLKSLVDEGYLDDLLID